FSSRRRHTRWPRDWSSDVCSSDLGSDIFLGWDNAFAPDGGPIAGGVHVRQISAVLDIGFATSDSGDNVVLAIDQSNGGGSNVERSEERRVGKEWRRRWGEER